MSGRDKNKRKAKMDDDKKLKQIQKLLDGAEGNLQSARNMLAELTGTKKTGKVDYRESAKDLSILDGGKVIEGVFDGEQMVAPDGKKYPVPANYASKSKLIEGDVLKLTIAEDGGLIYKQISPVERKNLIGTLAYENGNYSVLAEGKTYKVLFASVTYYKGKPGSQVSIVIPAETDSNWAAVESIIHNHGQDAEPKKEEKDEEPHVKLPEENIEILKEVKEEFSKDHKEKADKEENDAGSQKVIPRIEKENGNEDEKAGRATEAESREKPDAVDEAPKIKQSGSFISGDDKVVKEEKDTNSLGEKTPSEKSADIQELEI